MVVKRISKGREQPPKRMAKMSKAGAVRNVPPQDKIVVRGKRIDRMGAEQLRKMETTILAEANTLSEKLRLMPSSRTLPTAIAARKTVEREHAAAIADLRALRNSPLLRNEADTMPSLPSTWWRGVSRVFKGR